MKVYCDCKEINLYNGLTTQRTLDSADSDEAFGIFETALDPDKNCKHCGYMPMFQPHRDFDHYDNRPPKSEAHKNWWFK